MILHAPSLSPPRGRFAPSPTGRLHLGNAFAFLAAWLSIRRQGGRMVLRIEDIDPDRSRPEFVRAAMEDLAWLGLDWDEGPLEHPDGEIRGPRAEQPATFRETGLFGPYIQSLRLKRYEEILTGLRERGLVYPCYCTRKELRMLRKEGVFVPPAVYPAVPRNKARLRFCVISEHRPEQIIEALDKLAQCAKEAGIALPPA